MPRAPEAPRRANLVREKHLKGHNPHHSGHMGKEKCTEKTIEIQLVRSTVVCGKV